jgi:hypothetical protein
LALNDELLCVGEQRQENINIDIVVRQMTDIDRSRTGLRCIIPNDVTITRITASRRCIGAVQEQIR